jgi:heme/copper-type cytochrome/quinol oxidase subunit 2
MIEPEREVEAVTDVHVVLLLMLSSNGSSAEQHWKMRHAVAATIAVMIFFFIVIVVSTYCDAKIARNGKRGKSVQRRPRYLQRTKGKSTFFSTIACCIRKNTLTLPQLISEEQ